MKAALLFGLLGLLMGSGCRTAAPGMAPQFPSPMVEHTRAHERLQPGTPPALSFTLDRLFAKPVEVFVERSPDDTLPPNLLIHVHGAGFVPVAAIQAAPEAYTLAVVNLGSGSSAYERPFAEAGAFDRLLTALEEALYQRTGQRPTFDRITLSAFSAGYGAVRAILRQEAAFDRVDVVLLLDGLHTDYVPEGTTLAQGGHLNIEKLAPFLKLARAAIHGNKTFLLTHSEVFPGTYASTTETADYLIQALGLQRTPVLQWGPVGMQQLSEVRAGRFIVQGFAGNTAPDHVDHLHALPALLAQLPPPATIR